MFLLTNSKLFTANYLQYKFARLYIWIFSFKANNFDKTMKHKCPHPMSFSFSILFFENIKLLLVYFSNFNDGFSPLRSKQQNSFPFLLQHVQGIPFSAWISGINNKAHSTLNGLSGRISLMKIHIKWGIFHFLCEFSRNILKSLIREIYFFYGLKITHLLFSFLRLKNKPFPAFASIALLCSFISSSRLFSD